MNNTLRISVALLVAILFPDLQAAWAQDHWLTSLPRAAALARKEHKPLMVVFRCER